jgi:hypothetical protein
MRPLFGLVWLNAWVRKGGGQAVCVPPDSSRVKPQPALLHIPVHAKRPSPPCFERERGVGA